MRGIQGHRACASTVDSNENEGFSRAFLVGHLVGHVCPSRVKFTCLCDERQCERARANTRKGQGVPKMRESISSRLGRGLTVLESACRGLARIRRRLSPLHIRYRMLSLRIVRREPLQLGVPAPQVVDNQLLPRETRSQLADRLLLHRNRFFRLP